MAKPHKIVMHVIEERWQKIANRSWYIKLLQLPEIKPRMIVINHIEGLFETETCIQPKKTLNIWTYDDRGLVPIENEAELPQIPADQCTYHISEDKTKLKFSWLQIDQSRSSRKKHEYHSSRYIYDISREHEKIEDYEILRFGIS